MPTKPFAKPQRSKRKAAALAETAADYCSSMPVVFLRRRPHLAGRVLHEDLMSAAWIACLRAARIWRKNSRASFRTYACAAIERAVSREANRMMGRRLNYLECAGRESDGGRGGPEIADAVPLDGVELLDARHGNPAENVTLADSARFALRICDGLTSQYRKVLSLRADGYTFVEIGKALRISSVRAWAVNGLALQLVRDALAERGVCELADLV